MMLVRIFKWGGGLIVVMILAAVASVAAFGWNWLREPISRLTMERTGRELVIGGDLQLSLGWPSLHVRSTKVTFSNPPWASRKHMLSADDIDMSLNLPALFQRRLALDIVALRHGNVFLEANAAGQKNWLLDLKQNDEDARLHIGRLALEHSRIAYDDPAQGTSLVVDASTRDGSATADVVLRAEGRYRGLPLVANGSGGPVLALRDERQPYPFEIEATIGRTSARAQGTVTGISRLTAIDATVSVRGDSLAQLFPLLGIALPETHAYRTSGRIVHQSGSWIYKDFSAHIGDSDGAGTLQVDTGGKRPFLHGELRFGKLNFSDLGPVIGARNGEPIPQSEPANPGSTNRHGVLPDRPFRTERWDSVDADLKLSADTIIRARELPIDKLSTHLRMNDSILALDPLSFEIAAGTLGGKVELDGQRDPIRAHISLLAKNIVLDRLFPTAKIKSATIGHVTGKFDLAGTGNSVAHMLATANGRVGLVVDGGEVSKLTMEMAGLHVLEIVTLKLAGDKPIRIRCGMADFGAKDGVMRIEQLIFDTAVSNIDGSGSIDFGQEKLDLRLTPKSKEPSLIALRSPIYVRGSFARPQVDVDTGRIVARGLGALALGVANPLLALAPLIETGPGVDSDCGRLFSEIQQTAPTK